MQAEHVIIALTFLAAQFTLRKRSWIVRGAQGEFRMRTGDAWNLSEELCAPLLDKTGKFHFVICKIKERRRCAIFLSRSEEHTSELQSLRHLVCRLLLEKKK